MKFLSVSENRAWWPLHKQIIMINYIANTDYCQVRGNLVLILIFVGGSKLRHNHQKSYDLR